LESVMVAADVARPLAGLADGFVHGLIGHFADERLASLVARAGLPAVDISPAEPRARFAQVATDELAVGRLAAAHLLSLGLPRFAFFGARSHYSSLLRCKGFEQTIRAAGLNCHAFVDPNAESKPGALERWLLGLPKPIGVLASTDARALQLLAVCRKVGISVPETVAVLGVDNDDVFCELASPPLSSIALGTQQIGYEAARMLDLLMAGEKPAQRRLLVPPAGVVPRQSSDLPGILDADVAAAVRYISLHVQDHLQVADVLREVPMSRRSLDQRFLKALGRTPAAEIRRAQVELAKQMLSETEEPMSSVALAAGFGNAKQFSASFHQYVQLTPSAYRRRFRTH
jgi:LacI family transcriptional regulator